MTRHHNQTSNREREIVLLTKDYVTFAMKVFEVVS